MNKRIAIQKSKNYYEEINAALAILMAIATLAVIVFSVYSSI